MFDDEQVLPIGLDLAPAVRGPLVKAASAQNESHEAFVKTDNDLNASSYLSELNSVEDSCVLGETDLIIAMAMATVRRFE